MTTYASDAFNRVDTTLGAGGLGTADVGGSYTHRAGNSGINTNRARLNGANTVDTLATGHADGVLRLTILTLGLGIAFRYVDQNNFWFAMPYTDGQLYIGKYQGGSLSFAANNTATFEAGSILEVVLNAGAIEAKVSATAGGTPVSVTGLALTGQTFNQTATDHGPHNWGGSDGFVDDFLFISLSAIATKLAFTTQPAGFVSGVPHTTQPVVAVEAADGSTVTTDTSTITLALKVLTGAGTPIGTLTKVAVAGSADFAGQGTGVTAVNGAFQWEASDGTLIVGRSAVFIIGTLTPEQEMILALGGNSSVLAFYDGRGGVGLTGSLVQTWDDYRGSSGFGPQLVAGAAAGSKPLYDATAKTIETNQAGGNQNWLKSATDAKFDPTTPRTLVFIGTMENGQDFVAAFQDATQSKYAGLWSGVDGTTGLNTIEDKRSTGGNRNLFATPSTSRILSRLSMPGAAETAVGNALVIGQVAGKLAGVSRLTTAFAAGSWLLVVGGTSSSATTPKYSHSIVRAVLVIDHQLLAAEWDALVAWAVAQHAIVVDASKKGLVALGNSITEGVGASTGANSTFAKTMAHFPTVDGSNQGISGEDGSVITAMEAVSVLPSFHAARPKTVVWDWGEGTNEIQGGATATDVINRVIARAAAARGRGMLYCWGSILPFLSLGSAFDTIRLAVNSYFRTNHAAYLDGFADVALIPQMADPTSATYYDGFHIHPTDVGHDLCANDPTYGWAAALAPLLNGGPATHLVVITQPSSPLTSGTAHATQPAVAAKDDSGITDASYAATVTAALVVESGVGTPTGILARGASGGVANFAPNALGGTSPSGATAHWHFDDGTFSVDSATFAILPPPAVAGPTPLLVNGTDLASLGFVLESAPGWMDAPARQHPAVSRPLRAGTLLTAPAQEQPRKLTLQGVVRGGSVAAQRALIDLLKATLLKVQPTQLVFPDAQSRYVRGYLAACTVDPGAGPSMIARALGARFDFDLLDPYAYDLAAITLTGTATHVPVLGTAPSRPVITVTFTGSTATWTITVTNSANTLTYATLTLTGPFTAGQTVVVDMDAMTVTLDGAPRLDLITAGDFFALDVASQGDYTAGIWPTVRGSSACQLVYRKAWR